MKQVIEKYFKVILENLKNIKNYIKENKVILLMLLVYPILLHYVLQLIFGVVIRLNVLSIGQIIHEGILEGLPAKEFFFKFLTIFPKQIFYEYILIIGIIFIFWGILGKIKTSILITTIITVAFSSINYFIMQLRGIPFALSDIFSIETALNVASGYKVHISSKYILSIIFIFCYVGVVYFIGRKENKIKNKLCRIINIFLGIAMILCVNNSNYIKNYRIWNLTNEYVKRGQLNTILKQFNDIIIKKPENYSKERAMAILEKYKSLDKEENDNQSKTNEISGNKENVNVIVVMNESFSDLKNIYSLPMEENMPYFKSLKENTITGDLYTSTIGGGTATVEWEFLTGNSAAFIPYGSTPYLQYIYGDKENLVTDFNKLNYETLAFHSYKKTGYNREKVYKYFGFKDSYFWDDFASVNYINFDYPDDNSTYNDVLFKNDSIKNKNIFNFVITMQNHSPYEYRVGKTKDYIGIQEIDEYLTLINESDKALNELIKKLEKEEKKTVLLFFGDHQPGFVSNYEMFKEKNLNDNYKNKFLIWANYDIEEKENIEISSNYLSLLLTDLLEIENNDYINYLKYLKKEIPVITFNGYKGKDEKFYEITDRNSPYFELIQEYNIVQYYQMFDK